MRHTSRLLLAGLAALAAAAACNVRWNLGSSMAPGLYVERNRAPERGDLVVVCLPEAVGRWARGRAYLGCGGCPGRAAAIGKRVAATEGDVIEVQASAIAVNGQHLEGSARVDRDARDRPVPLLGEGERRIATGHVWLHSGRHGRSLDSRVFGPVPVSQVRGVLVPLWTPGVD